MQTAAYLAICTFRRRPIRVGKWEIPLPPPWLLIGQIAAACADLLVAAAVLYVLLPPNADTSYLYFLGIFLLGMVVAVFTHVPAGAGVFELIIVSFYKPEVALGSMLAFRGVYYLLPLLVASVLLAIHEALAGRKFLKKVVVVLDAVNPTVVPPILAFVVFLAGAFLLISGATPAMDRRSWEGFPVPLPLLEASHVAGGVVGVTLLFLAYGVLRRLRSAYWSAVALVAVGSVLALLSGVDYWGAILLLGMLGALLPSRQHFRRRGWTLRQPFASGWLTAVALVLGLSISLALFAFKRFHYSNSLWWTFGLYSEVTRSLRTMTAASITAVVLAVVSMIRPKAAFPHRPSEEELAASRLIAAASPKSYANLALLGDKMHLLNDRKTALVMYAIQGRSWVAMGDPVGPEPDVPDLLWQFRDLCDAHNGRPVFYQADEDHLPLYVDLGLDVLHLGDEARVALADFSIDGPHRVCRRQTCASLEERGYLFEVLPQEAVSKQIPALRVVSEAWLGAANSWDRSDCSGPAESRFSLGYFDPRYLSCFPVATIRRETRILAFANLWTAAGKEELAADLVRFLPESPEGILDYLLVRSMQWAREEGYRWFNLGVAPITGPRDQRLAPFETRIESIVARAQGDSRDPAGFGTISRLSGRIGGRSIWPHRVDSI